MYFSLEKVLHELIIDFEPFLKEVREVDEGISAALNGHRQDGENDPPGLGKECDCLLLCHWQPRVELQKEPRSMCHDFQGFLSLKL